MRKNAPQRDENRSIFKGASPDVFGIGKRTGTEQQGKGQGIMRGLVGDRLLNRFFGSILRRPGFNSPEVLEPGQDNPQETTQRPSELKPGTYLDTRETVKTEEVIAVTVSSDP